MRKEALRVLFYIFWYQGLRKVSGTTAALFTSVMPISATLLAIVFLDAKRVRRLKICRVLDIF